MIIKSKNQNNDDENDKNHDNEYDNKIKEPKQWWWKW